MFGECELADLQAEVAGLFDQTATRKRNNPTVVNGSQKADWDTLDVEYPCLVLPGEAPKEETHGDRTSGISYWIVQLPVSADVRPTDRLVIAGRTYEVTGTDAGASFDMWREVRCWRADR